MSQRTTGKIEFVKFQHDWLSSISNGDGYKLNTIIKFSYIVNDQTYINNDKLKGPFMTGYEDSVSYAKEKEIYKKKYPIGGNINVYYNPNNPSKSKLLESIDELKSELMISSFLGLFLIFAIVISCMVKGKKSSSCK